LHVKHFWIETHLKYWTRRTNTWFGEHYSLATTWKVWTGSNWMIG
jgi:hypothetical protein